MKLTTIGYHMKRTDGMKFYLSRHHIGASVEITLMLGKGATQCIDEAFTTLREAQDYCLDYEVPRPTEANPSQ